MPDPQILELIEEAKRVQGHFQLREDFSAGAVGAAVRSASGRIYTGICVDLACGVGFCAEHSAIAAMLKHREVQVSAIVAVGMEGIMPPCGRCRELMAQLSEANLETVVVLGLDRVVPLKDLLPHHWL